MGQIYLMAIGGKPRPGWCLLPRHTIFLWLKTGKLQNESCQINVVHILLSM